MMYSIIKGFNDDIIGISPDVQILSVKVLSEEESIKPKVIAKAITLAITEKVTIINLSIASYKYNDEIANAIRDAVKNNITVVVSSGDYSDTKMMFPANMKEVVSVGAINKKNEISDLTSGSNLTTINAPGIDIKTLDLNEKSFYSSGTSQATALISGYVALLKDYAINNGIKLENEDIITYLSLIKENKLRYKDVFKKISNSEDL